MRLRFFLPVLVSLLLPALNAHADTFSTTISGPGLTLVFPDFGGPLPYLENRLSEIQAGGLSVTVNGVSTYMGYPAQGELDFLLNNSSPNYHDLNVRVSGIPELLLYGPNLVGLMNGFYSFPGTYNLADANGVPYTYIVTDETLAAVPEPSTLALLTTSLAGIISLARRRAPSPCVGRHCRVQK